MPPRRKVHIPSNFDFDALMLEQTSKHLKKLDDKTLSISDKRIIIRKLKIAIQYIDLELTPVLNKLYRELGKDGKS
jgi:hypothetical protein